MKSSPASLTKSPAMADTLLATGLMLGFLAGFLFRSDGGINLDALMYARHAILLPEMADNLCPPAYPLLLRGFEFFAGDYFLAGKVLNGCCLLLLLFFAWKRDFYFRETLFLLCTRAGSGIWSFSFSEIPFLTILYFQFYLAHRFAEQKAGNGEMAAMVLLQGALLLLRHAAVFLFPGMLVAAFLLPGSGDGSRKRWLQFLWLSALLSAGILVWNYISFGSFFGENFRGTPDAVSAEEWKEHFFLNLRGLFGFANPFFSLVFQFGEAGWASVAALLLDGFFLLLFIRYSLRIWHSQELFSRILFITGSFYLLLLFASSFSAGIETLSTRLMAPGLWCLYFPVLIYLNSRLKPAAFVTMSVICLLISIGYVLKTPSWYPSIRADARKLLIDNPQARWFFIDRDSIPLRHYSIPFTGISLSYLHPVLAESYVNQHALMILKPQLELIDSSKAAKVPEQQILFNSRCSAVRNQDVSGRKIR